MAFTVSYLEMRSPAALKPKHFPDPRFAVREATVKQWEFNRFLYLLVGREWHWNDKRGWSEAQWKAYAESENLQTFVAYYDGSVAGYFEMRPDKIGGVEIAILGMAPRFLGRGFGAALLTHALEAAWRHEPTRVWLHTCSFDHPAALPNYQARGMTVYKVETTSAKSAS
jgi:GNAT superfamily N-acetyltransferase